MYVCTNSRTGLDVLEIRKEIAQKNKETSLKANFPYISAWNDAYSSKGWLACTVVQVPKIKYCRVLRSRAHVSHTMRSFGWWPVI